MIIIEEKKDIKILVLNDGKEIAGTPYRQIMPYYENGQMAAVVWFDVRRNGETEQKVNGAHVRQIVYK